MSDNKFIKRLKGEQAAKSVLEIKNESAKTSFANMPKGTSNAIDVYSDHRGNATAVLEGTDIWKLNNSQFVAVPNAFGDGQDFTSTYTVAGTTLWVNATHTFDQPKIFTGATQWTLKLCGHSLLSSLSNTIGFSLIIKLGNAVTITKSFSVSESAFEFCKEFIIDFSESEQSAIKVANGDTMTVQLLCADATASATIYNGMTTLVAQQRRVDGEAVASDLHTFEDLEVEIAQIQDDIVQIHEDIDDLEEYVDDTFVRLDGTSTMTAPLKFMAGSMRGAVGPYLNGLGFWKLDSQGNLTQIATISDSRFIPTTTNSIDIGRSANTWKDLYLGGKAYVATINNGADLSVPNKTGTLATMGDVELAARSGRMLTDQGVWYAKMYSATVAPAAENGTNYADFSQVDSDNNPIIVIYTRTSGAWVQTETITPPAEYDGYVPITSKIWDIAEQSGQQGGRILWNHQSKEFTPYPQIISFEDIEVTGNSTVIMPQTPSVNQIVNKNYVDNKVSSSIGNGTIIITQGGTTKGSFTTNQSNNTTIDIDAGGGGSGLNVGDIFFTMRNDNELNGAVECDGATYNTTDFTGAQSIGALLVAGKVPYVSLSQYATLLSTQGSVGVFGWNGGNATTFRVPSLNDIFVETGTAAQVGDYLPAGLPNIKGWGQLNDDIAFQAAGGALYLSNSYARDVAANRSGSQNHNINLDASRSSSVYKDDVTTVQPNTVRYRAMVQLATSASDEALETCTSVLADVAALKYDYVVDFQAPTAANNYTWYRKYKSGWVEQGGVTNYSTGGQTVDLPVIMADTNYSVSVTIFSNSGFSTTGGNTPAHACTAVSTTQIRVNQENAPNKKSYWEVKGMAQG